MRRARQKLVNARDRPGPAARLELRARSFEAIALYILDLVCRHVMCVKQVPR
jgi:hypothetical protein